MCVRLGLEFHVADVVGCACKVENVVALLHHLVDSGTMLLRLGVAITCTVDEFVDDVVKPQKVGVRFVAGKIVSGNGTIFKLKL